ncbi:MAG: beta-Ala-His dipeptidase [Oscillospiraceae bacterium]|nr:beta-Ala-His dipeptidase [Oscillospiraceae bacterium]
MSANLSPLQGIEEKRILDLPGYIHVPLGSELHYESPVVMNYIQEFADLTQVPHPSHHEGRIADYLLAWAAAHGVEAEKDEMNNVVIFLPATPGFENAPTVIVQGHMDMVPACDEGVVHDWENDPLELEWTANSVKARGTTLGADNGTGIAFMLNYIDYADKFVHGPMRMICTVCEEVGLLGAHALDAKYVQGASYMINGDGGYGMAIISCAGGKYFDFSHKAEWSSVPEGFRLMTLEIGGLRGGHSGMVGHGQVNALAAIANALLTLSQSGVALGLLSFTGGSANNVIPGSAKAVAAIRATDWDQAVEVLEGFKKRLFDAYLATEKDMFLTFAAGGSGEKMLKFELSRKLVQLMSTVPNNIHSLLTTAEGTQCSSNLGTIRFGEDELSFTCFMRSSSVFHAEQVTLAMTALAELCGFELNIPATMAAWPPKAENRLGEMAQELFRELTGNEYKLLAIHAGVECGEFAEKNPEMSIISTGVGGGSGAHATVETMNFDLTELSLRFLTALIEKLAREG